MHIGSCENIAVQAGTNRNTLTQNEGSDGILAKEDFEPPENLHTFIDSLMRTDWNLHNHSYTSDDVLCQCKALHLWGFYIAATHA